MAIPLFSIFHTSYVTRDLSEGIAAMQEAFSIERFHIMRDMTIPMAPGEAHIHVAMAYVDDRQIELIEPVGGADGLYRDALPSQGAQFHHFGCQITSEGQWKNLMDDIQGNNLPVVAGRESRDDEGRLGISFVYIDRRATVGHITEFMYFPGGDKGCGLFDTTPRFYS